MLPSVCNRRWHRHLLVTDAMDIRSPTGVFQGQCHNLSLGIQVEGRTLVEIARFNDGPVAERDEQRVTIEEVLDFHSTTMRPKNGVSQGFGDSLLAGLPPTAQAWRHPGRDQIYESLRTKAQYRQLNALQETGRLGES